LRAWTIDVAGVEELGEPIIGAVEGAADKRRDVGGSQEAMSRQVAHDNNVIIGQAECRRLRRTAEPRPADRRDKRLCFHADIIPRRNNGRPEATDRENATAKPGHVATGRGKSGQVGTANLKRGTIADLL